LENKSSNAEKGKKYEQKKDSMEQAQVDCINKTFGRTHIGLL